MCRRHYWTPPVCELLLSPKGRALIKAHSSLVTTLRAAELFEKSHLASPEVAPLIESATHFYGEGFFLTHGTESYLELAKKASEAGKVFALNLSAPFIAQFFKVQLEQIIPYADIVIGNESEAAAWAEASGLPVCRLVALIERRRSSNLEF